MKKFLTGIVMGILTMVIAGLTVSAAVITTAEPDYANATISISGTLTYPGDAAVYTSYYDEAKQAYLLDSVYQMTCGEDRTFAFSIPIIQTNSLMRITVSGMDYRETNHSIEMYFYTEEVYQTALAMLDSAEDIKKLFEDEAYSDYKNALALNTECLELIPDKSGVYQALAEHAATYDDIEASLSAWKEYYAYVTAANAIGQASEATQAYELYQKYAKELGVEQAKYVQYLKGEYFLPKLEERVVDSLRGKSYVKASDFRDALDEQIVMKAPKYLVYWTDLTTVLRLFETSLTGIHFSGYEALGDKKATVDGAVAGVEYESCTALVTAYNNAVTKAGEGGSGGGGGSIGGSSLGGGFGGSVSAGIGSTLPEISVPAKEENAEAPEENEVFSDLAGYDWALEAVKALKERGYISGDGTGRFYPGNPVTRSEFVKMVCELFRLTGSYGEDSPFSDVSEQSWQYPYIMAAVEHGIILGRDDGSFGAEDPVTRQEMAVIVYRAMENHGCAFGSPQGKFEDESEIAQWAKSSVEIMAGMGILEGYENRFNPEDFATRAEAACMLLRVMNVL